MNRVKIFIENFKLLIKSVPATTVSIFVMSVIAMNLLANKSINTGVDWLALDCGIIVSWISFLCMDILTKHFGPKAATQISLFAIVLNLLACLIFFVASRIDGVWGQYYDLGEVPIINTALDGTFAGSWYVVFGSTIAFIMSAIINNITNWGIGKLFGSKDGFGVYICRTYISTAIGQFADNLIFSLIVSHFFFGWSILQCITCAVTGMIVELLCESIFSPLGYMVCKRWQKEEIGKEYLTNIKEKL